MQKTPLVSVIIPLYVIEDRFFEDLKKFEKLNYGNFEVIVVSDTKVDLPRFKKAKVRLLLTNKKRTGPAEKRDLALKKAKGQICAFIDDDAYPDPDWLKNAVVHFNHPKIAAVGGPGITPKEDGYWEQLTGLVYSSFFCGGFAQYRFVKGKMQFVDDYPAYNLLVRKDVLKKVGGYGTHFYGGEDTFLCLKIVKKGFKILYDPDAAVYHHRRPLFVPYLKQIANIGTHRGYFAKKFPETSLKFFYFMPSFFASGFFILLIGSLMNRFIFIFFAILLSLFVYLVFVSVTRKTKLLELIIVSTGIILTHLVYGIYFVRGILVSDLKK